MFGHIRYMTPSNTVSGLVLRGEQTMRIRQRLAAVSMFASVLLLYHHPAEAQFNSAIEGTISDSTGGVVPGAAVTLTNQDTGVANNAQTTDAGYFRFPALGNGLYT